MRHLRLFLLAVSATLLVSCGGGGGSSESSTPTGGDTPIADNQSKTTLVYSQSPIINQELTLSVLDNTNDAANGYSWKILKQPASSNLQLTPAADNKSVQLTPTIAGEYEVAVTPTSGDVLETQFLVSDQFPINEAKLEGYDATLELSRQSGIILNQVWVYSKTLNQTAIEAKVNNYNNLSSIGFDPIRGVLVQFDETSAQSQSDIKTLKTIAGIDSVDQRVFVGSNFEYPLLKIADDGSAFDDGGDNWHLESISIGGAWDVTTGNDEFFIGVTDIGFFPQHEDLRGRFKESTTSNGNIDDTHGTGVAGAMAAISNNKKGISGINWSNQIIAGGIGYDALNNMMSKDNVLLSNNSWSLIPNAIASRFDPENADSVEEITRISLAQTSDFRKLATEHASKLFVFGAGNGIANGQGNSNGVYGVNGLYGSPALHYEEVNGVATLSRKDNVLFVAAYLIDSKLPYYSNYGESVDIAAPSHYKSTKRNSDPFESPVDRDEYYTGENYATNTITSAGFTGTSAATPVVTGVASLIFAADPSLSAANVKSILIKSATNVIAERYTTPFKDADGNYATEILDRAIPRLNAASALSMTREIVDAKEISVDHEFPSPFDPTVNVTVSNANDDIQIQSFDYVVSAKNNGTLETLFDGTVAGFSPLVFQAQNSDATNYVVKGTTNSPAHEPTGLSLNSSYNYEFLIPKVMALASDLDTQASIPNVFIDIKADDGSVPLTSDTTNANGTKRLFLKPGKYTIIARAEGYDNLNKSFTLKDTDLALDVILELSSSTNNPPVGVTGNNLEPITPLTSSEIFTLPVSNVPGISSLTGISESGFNGSIEDDFSLVEGVSSINAVDVQRDIGISVICDNGTKTPFLLNASDFSSGVINETFYDNGQQVAACSSSYASVLPLTLTNSNLGILEDWGSEGQLSSNCPIENGNSTTPPPLQGSLCTSIITSNYLITDSSGVEHKISTRLTTTPNQ